MVNVEETSRVDVLNAQLLGELKTALFGEEVEN